ncbi:F0F1 ATP synthase subunit A [[Mycoplasma] mobile]|nr:F0F1 ATP synthase subunit A [[Mycoplasma] mobile]
MANNTEENILLSQINNWIQPQLISLIFVTLVLILISVVVYFKVKKVKPNESPYGVALLSEQYVTFVDDNFQAITGGKIDKVGPYIFTLITFLVVGNILGIFGLEPITTSYSVPLTLALITWLGTYVIAIIFQKWRKLRKYLKVTLPFILIGEFSPIISLSFRIFGNIIGGSTILFLIYFVTGYIWGFIPIIGQVNLLGAVLAPALNLYFDLFGGLIQAYLFTILTMVFWTLETDIPEKKKKKILRKDIASKTTLENEKKLQLV